MSHLTSKTAQKFQDIINEYGVELKVVEFSESTRTAKEAAEVAGCKLGQIAKSIVFKTGVTEQPVLVIASGVNRVSERKIASYIGEPIEKADAQFVLEQIGYAIGGVPPFGHKQDIIPFIDEDLLKYEEIWGAAGTPHAIFPLTPEDLLTLSKGKVVSVK